MKVPSLVWEKIRELYQSRKENGINAEVAENWFLDITFDYHTCPYNARYFQGAHASKS